MNAPVEPPASASEPPASSTAVGTTGRSRDHAPKAAATAISVGTSPRARHGDVTELTSSGVSTPRLRTRSIYPIALAMDTKATTSAIAAATASTAATTLLPLV